MSAKFNDSQSEVTNGLEVPPIARLDFLSSGGAVKESEEYFDEDTFIKALREELYYGVPLIVVLYRNQYGETIPTDFLDCLDTLPKGLKVEDLRHTQSENISKKENLRATIQR
jgi:hypothetical protein